MSIQFSDPELLNTRAYIDGEKRVFKEEIFCPIAPLFEFRDEQAAIDTPFGGIQKSGQGRGGSKDGLDIISGSNTRALEVSTNE